MRRLPRGACIGMGVMALAIVSAGCARADTAPAPWRLRTFTCDAGISFSALMEKDTAMVFTSSQRYRLQARRSTLGVRYGSEEVAFALDEDRAVLVGAADGPYRDCRDGNAETERA